MYSPSSVEILANEVFKRIPQPVLRLPVGLNQQKYVIKYFYHFCKLYNMISFYNNYFIKLFFK